MNVISFQEFLEFFNFPFVWYALIICVLTALCAALLGVTLVLKRFSFIGDGLSHVAFGGQAVAAVVAVLIGHAFDFNDTFIVLPITVIAAILLLKTGGRKTKLNGDATLALISVSSLALGYLIYSFSDAVELGGRRLHDALRLLLHPHGERDRPMDVHRDEHCRHPRVYLIL